MPQGAHAARSNWRRHRRRVQRRRLELLQRLLHGIRDVFRVTDGPGTTDRLDDSFRRLHRRRLHRRRLRRLLKHPSSRRRVPVPHRSVYAARREPHRPVARPRPPPRVDHLIHVPAVAPASAVDHLRLVAVFGHVRIDPVRGVDHDADAEAMLRTATRAILNVNV